MSSEEKNHQRTTSIAYFWLNSLESLLNAFVDLDPTTRRQLDLLDGLVVRVKTFAPYQVFYLLFTTDGIEVSPRPQGEVQVRLSGKVRDLVWTLLGLESESYAEAKGHLNIWGDSSITNHLRALLQDFNLRSAAGHWLKNHWPLNMLWQKLSEQDLSWLQDLQPLPALIRQTREELAALKTDVQRQQALLEQLQQAFNQQLFHTRLMLGLMISMCVFGLGAWIVTLIVQNH